MRSHLLADRTGHVYLASEIANSTSLTLDACTRVSRNMMPEVRAIFPSVESLVRLLLVNSMSSVTVERSFRGLGWAVSSLFEINNLAICHVRKDIMGTIGVRKLMK